MRRSGFVIVIVIAGLSGMQAASPASADEAHAPPCPLALRITHLGLACRDPSGLLQTFAEDGTPLGTTHGVDVFPDEPAGASIASTAQPRCVKDPDANDYYVKVIYARPNDVASRYSSKKDDILATILAAGGQLMDAASATGGFARIRVLCNDAGEVRVYNEVLAHNRAASDEFSNVVSDLRALGHTQTNVKHWVFVDGGPAGNICNCGVAHIQNDDDLELSNLNNGNSASSQFAVSWNMDSRRIALHELSHNMGAVQRTAPHTTSTGVNDPYSNSWHCNDGLDTMCYRDGGANQCTSGELCPGRCGTEVYDCGKDDYFNRDPGSSNYLRTHWNVGNTLNRFLFFSVPEMRSLSCTSPIGVMQTTTCTMRATDDSDGIRYSVRWGDGETACVPSCSSYVDPGVSRTASHRYDSGGTKTVRVSATDNGSPAQTGTSITDSVVVDATDPVTTLTTLSTLSPYADSGASPPWYDENYRFSLAATDTGGTGLDGIFFKIDSDAYQRYTAAQTESANGAHTVSYYARDNGDNLETVRSKGFGVDKTLPTADAPTPSCDPCVGNVSVSFHMSDPTSKLYKATLEWSFSPTELGISGEVCTSTNVRGLSSATRTCEFGGYQGLVPGEYCFESLVTDRAGNRARSEPTCIALVPLALPSP